MNRIEEINARLSVIASELETATGEVLNTLEREVQALTEERSAIQAENTRRQQLRSQVAAGSVGAPSPVAPAAPAAAPAADRAAQVEAEERAFADYIRGTVTQMRSNTPQNFSLANNGAILPTSIANRIIEKVKEICPILQGADIYRTKGTLKIPVYGDKADGDNNLHNITVAYGTEFSDLTADAGAFTSVDLTGYLLGALTLVGRSVQNNADVDVVSFVVNKMSAKIAEFLEGELLKGTGSANSHMTGALSTTTTMNAGSTSAISADNLIELQAKIPTAYQAGACWVMNPATFTVLKKLKDANGQYLLQQAGGLVDAFPFTILGKPVYLSDNMPTIASAAKAVLYGHFSGMAVNIREDVSVEVLREKYATQHAIGIVAWMEVDSKIQDNSKLATLVMSAG